MSRSKRNALGRGLGALLPNKHSESNDEPQTSPAKGPPRQLPIEQLEPNPEQPRKHFDTDQLEELAASIRAHGILQPIVVTPQPIEPGGARRYTIIAGERRWRAAQQAGLHDVPVFVRDVAEDDRLELALIENIQRADLNPIEEARAYAELITMRSYTQEELAHRVGKDRSTVSNAMRLLKLPAKVQDLVQEGQLSMGHARALLGLESTDDMSAIASDIVHQRLSVRATEQAVRKRLRADEASEPSVSDDEKRRKIIVGELEHRLRRRIGTRVKLKAQGGKSSAGAIEIPYGSLDELDRILRILLSDAE